MMRRALLTRPGRCPTVRSAVPFHDAPLYRLHNSLLYAPHVLRPLLPARLAGFVLFCTTGFWLWQTNRYSIYSSAQNLRSLPFHTAQSLLPGKYLLHLHRCLPVSQSIWKQNGNEGDTPVLLLPGLPLPVIATIPVLYISRCASINKLLSKR